MIPSGRYVLADEVGLGKTIEACVILRGLRRRHPTLRALLVVPSSLAQQWQNELSAKFWLDFPVARASGALANKYVEAVVGTKDMLGAIVTTEDLDNDDALWEWVQRQHWDLIIVDEAHQLHKTPILYDRVRALSATTNRALLLSATPIQNRTDEYLALLAILDPQRYDPRDVDAFRRVLNLQDPIRQTVAFLALTLTPEDFDSEEFEEEFETILEELNHDRVLAELAARVPAQAKGRDRGLAAAKEALAYLSENYRIEHRVIRNRRAHLQITLPARALNTSYCYEPSEEEDAAFEALVEYLEPHLANESLLSAEYARVLLHAGMSSPHALLAALEARESMLYNGSRNVPKNQNLASLAAPRAEQRRIAQLIAAVAPTTDEVPQLERLTWIARRWYERTEAALDQACARWPTPPEDAGHRLVQALLATSAAMQTPGVKVLVFSSWQRTLDALLPRVARLQGSGTIAQFTAALGAEQLVEEADRFQARDDCRLLFSDELGGEGRNFQIADRILHLDLPWTPAQLEQRIGRVDRFGRSGRVLSIVPFARERLEHDLFRLWQEAFLLFTQSMSGLEIALEGVQAEVRAALKRSIRHGIADLLPTVIARTARLRAEVEKERYFEESAIKKPRRQEFQSVSERYRNGEMLRGPFLRWANLAGLRNSYSAEARLALFRPREFSLKSIYNAKFFDPPNMEEALARSGRLRDQVIRGTFDRDIAVRREDYVFFAPGTDPWTDALVANAIEADRGRCCAILRATPELDQHWFGIEFRFSLSIDPRPLLAAGHSPMHLYHAQGFLNIPAHRIVIGTDGVVLNASHLVSKLTERPFDKAIDRHLGKRDGPDALLPAFKVQYPTEMWSERVATIYSVVQDAIEKDFDFTGDIADQAREEFDRRLSGWQAAQRWLHGDAEDVHDPIGITDYKQVTAALTVGLRRPLRRLESVCFWILQVGRL